MIASYKDSSSLMETGREFSNLTFALLAETFRPWATSQGLANQLKSCVQTWRGMPSERNSCECWQSSDDDDGEDQDQDDEDGDEELMTMMMVITAMIRL